MDGEVHTNGIESVWAVLKRGYHGVYHRMSLKHLPRYLDEFAGRLNSRSGDTLDPMAGVVRAWRVSGYGIESLWPDSVTRYGGG